MFSLLVKSVLGQEFKPFKPKRVEKPKPKKKQVPGVSDERRDRFIKALGITQWKSTPHIAKLLKIEPQNANTALKKLEAAGLVEMATTKNTKGNRHMSLWRRKAK